VSWRLTPWSTWILIQSAVYCSRSQSLRQAYTAEGEDALRRALLKPLPVKVLRGHTDRVNDIAFSPDGKQLVSVCDDKTARLWDVATGRPSPP